MPRYVTLSVKVYDETKKDLEIIASNYGLPTTRLAAYIVGEWIAKQKQGTERGPALATADNYGTGVPE